MEHSLLVTLECGSRVISVGTGGDLALLGISGIEAAEYEVDIESNGSLDGGYVAGARIAQRTISITTHTGSDDPETMRSRLIHLFRPHPDTKVTVSRNGISRWIIGRCLEPVFTQANMYQPARVTIKIVCPQPYFCDPDNFGQDITRNIDNVVMPFIIPPEGLVVSMLEQNSSVELTNGGDVACGLRAHIEMHGPVTDPCIINTGTGEHIRVLGSFDSGDVLVISTEQRAKSVQLNGQNHMHRLDRSSVFFSLAVGDNTIRYSASDGHGNMAMYIYYTPLYLGV